MLISKYSRDSQLLPCGRCLPLTTIYWKHSLARIIILVLCSTATTHDDMIFFWTSPIAWNKRYSQSDVISDFRSTWMCLTGSIALQCGLSGGKLKICHYFSAASHHGKVLSPAMRRWGPIPRLCGDEADVAGATKSIVTHLLVMSKIFSGSSISSKWSK